MSSETFTPEGQARIEESVQAALKRWPIPWRRYNGRIVALNGATVGSFSPKVAVSNAQEVAPDITAGAMNLADFTDTISQLVGLGEIMERAFKFSDVSRMERLERRHSSLLASNAALKQQNAALVKALEDLTNYADCYGYGKAWAGRPHQLCDAARAALKSATE